MFSKLKRPYDPEQLEPRTRLRRNLQDIFATNSLSTDRVAELARDFHRVDAGSFCDLGRYAGKKSSNQARNVRRNFLKRTTWMPVYWAQIRCENRRTGEEELEWVAFNLPHEIVKVLAEQGLPEKIEERAGLDPLALEHLLECEQEAACKLIGIGLWADGTPCNWDRTETVDTLSMNLPGLVGEQKNLRIPVTAISHKHVGGNTWHDINAVVKWSLMVLATGQWPTCRHDGSQWFRKSDHKRKSGPSILRCCLVEVRADWDWMAKVYGFAYHNLLEGNCWKCKNTPDKVRGIHQLVWNYSHMKASSVLLHKNN